MIVFTNNVPINRLEQEAQFSLGRTSEITRDELKFQNVTLKWENDLKDNEVYELYRSTDPKKPCNESNKIAITTNNYFIDTNVVVV